MLFGLFLAPMLPAQGTRQWTTSRYEEFERGTPTNIALRNDGRLEPAPALRTIASTPAVFLWSIAQAGGNLYAGSGAASGGSQVLRIDSKGAVTTAASFKELNVQALLPMSDGSVLAATSLPVAWLVVFGSLVGYTAYIYLLEHVPVAKVATYAYVNPIVAVGLGAALLGERLVGMEYAGMAAILAAVYLVTSSKMKAMEEVVGEVEAAG